MTPIRYRIQPSKPAAHLFQVSCEVTAPDPAGQIFRLPAWIPGSYMIREFARNIVTLRGEADGRPVALNKLDKHSWQAPPLAGHPTLTVHYEVYAWDLSVRAAHLDDNHGFFNGTSVFLHVVGQESHPCLVDIQAPEGQAYQGWQVATALAEATGYEGCARRHGFGLYRAGDYDELLDHPVEMGAFTQARFDAGGVPHEVIITGRHDCDLPRLTAHLQQICQWQIDLFGAPPPMARYLFLIQVVGEGYGGLEHRASTALLVSRNDLPYPGMEGLPAGYQSFLGLCSHEYFHTWNVKRIKPAAFVPYDLSQEAHTRLLWAFEGFTSYYDDLALVRSRVITADDYLTLLAKSISNVLKGTGRFKQSLAEASFDAWTKYYRQDENAPNAIVSYYTKGALVALALDLQLRIASHGKTSLDHLMVQLWTDHGQTGRGVAEEGLFQLTARIGGPRLARWLKQAVEGTQDLPLERWLKPLGITLSRQAETPTPWLGVKLAPGKGEAHIAQVFDDGPAQAAGLSAGDVLVAVNGLRVDTANLDACLARHRPGTTLTIHAFRRDELMSVEVRLAPPPKNQITLALAPKPTPAARALRRAWLGV